MSGNPAPPAMAETHISWVLLTGERAFKFAKPVRTDVVDQSTAERRREVLRREVELNARLAPDVYLGVGEVALDGTDLEPVIVMTRMPDDRRLTTLLDGTDDRGRTPTDHVTAVARTVASFHTRAQVLAGDDAARVASADALRTRWEADLAGMREVGGAEAAERVDVLEERALTYLHGRDPLFEGRIADGMVRDGHGDLLADDVFCLDDGPRILDCLAFSDDLRWNDVLADVAFLVMDLERLGHPELGRLFLRRYCELSGERHPGSLAHLHVAQRALVRAKVGALRHGGITPAEDRLLALAADHLDRATVRAVLVGGLPGSGKSTLAEHLGDELGWAVLGSDEVRRDLGLRYADLRDESAYQPETVSQVYAEVLRRADELMAHGVSVVLDATWTSASEREKARATAAGRGAEVLEVRCDAPVEVSRARVARRRPTSESEATPEVVDALLAHADPWPEAVVVDTSGAPPAAPWTVVTAATRGLWWRATGAAPPPRSRRPG